MTPAVRPLPGAFKLWLQVSTDDEVIALLRLLQRTLEARGFMASVTWAKPEAKPAA